jgi:hypothetical protein
MVHRWFTDSWCIRINLRAEAAGHLRAAAGTPARDGRNARQQDGLRGGSRTAGRLRAAAGRRRAAAGRLRGSGRAAAGRLRAAAGARQQR